MMRLLFLMLVLLHVLITVSWGRRPPLSNNHLSSVDEDRSHESKEEGDNDEEVTSSSDEEEEEENEEVMGEEDDAAAGGGDADAVRCTTGDCANRSRQAQQHLAPAELRMLRLEGIKIDILNKLRLKEPPNVTVDRDQLPAPLWAGQATAFGGHTDVTTDLEDFYGRTEQVALFAGHEDRYRCKTSPDHPAACLTFTLGPDFPEGEITSAQLWVYKLRNRREVHNQTFELTEVSPENHHTIKRRSRAIEIQTDSKHGWVTFDLLHVAKRWFHHFHHHNQRLHSVQVKCKTCASANTGMHLPISDSANHRAFLLITTDGGDGRSRSKRSTNCNSETTDCCREQLFVSFQEIGWSDWIIHPHGYMANFCRGSCMEDVAIPLGRTHHAAVMLRYAQNKKFASSTKTLQLNLCCTPTRMSSISLLYMDENRVYQKNLPNMVVDSCGCS